MEISTAMLKDVREKTGAGIVDCKQTLVETNGDINKAIEILQKKGLNKAEKKSGRTAKEGTVAYKLDGKKGLVLKVNCETDFVAKTENFTNFVKDALELIYKKGYPFSTTLPEDLENLRKNIVAKVGENILVSDWKFIEAKSELYPYLHKDKFAVKVAVIADIGTDKNDDETCQLLKNITMQITAMNPVAVSSDKIPAETLDNLKTQFTEEAKQTGKPEKVMENIVKGKFEKFYNESVLLEQAYILDEDKKVKTIIEDYSKAKGVNIKVNGFVRVAL